MENELISRNAAIDALKEAFNPSITNFVKAKLAIENLPSAQPDLPIKEKCAFCPHCKNCDVNDDLSIQPCVDTISRQAVIDTVRKIILGFFSDEDGAMTDTEKTLLSVNKAVCNGVRELPSASRPHGQWLFSPDDAEGTCTICQYKIYGRKYQGHYLIVPYNFCPNCGADMTEESEEPKRCDTCKHEKSRWFSRCADCSDYESWEGKDETGRSTTEN